MSAAVTKPNYKVLGGVGAVVVLVGIAGGRIDGHGIWRAGSGELCPISAPTPPGNAAAASPPTPSRSADKSGAD